MSKYITPPSELKSEQVVKGTKQWSGKVWLLTYPTHLKESVIEILERKTKPFGEWIMSHEIGESEYEHTHIFVWMSENFRTRNCDWADIDGLHPHVRWVKNNAKNRERVKQYVSKNPIKIFKGGNELKKIEGALSKRDALLAIGDLKKALQVSVAYDILNTNNDPEVFDFEPRPWQQEIMNIVDGSPSSRASRNIWWIRDEIGAAGKSYLAKYLASVRKAHVLGKVNAADGAHILKKMMEREYRPSIVFDFTRSTEACVSFYDLIEGVKDGRITATKYNSEVIWIKDVHVIVFANFWPEVRRLSLDRWKLKDIKDGVMRDVEVTELEW